MVFLEWLFFLIYSHLFYYYYLVGFTYIVESHLLDLTHTPLSTVLLLPLSSHYSSLFSHLSLPQSHLINKKNKNKKEAALLYWAFKYLKSLGKLKSMVYLSFSFSKQITIFHPNALGSQVLYLIIYTYLLILLENIKY